MYTSKGFTVVMPNGHTSSFKTPATGDAINEWKEKQKEIDVEWPDRPDVSPVKPEVAEAGFDSNADDGEDDI